MADIRNNETRLHDRTTWSRPRRPIPTKFRPPSIACRDPGCRPFGCSPRWRAIPSCSSASFAARRAIFPATKLSIRQREVLLHRVTARCGCEDEWGMRVHYFAGEAGLTAAQIGATVHGDADSACWEANDALLIRLADELHDTCDISDELWPALRAAFEDEAILELLMLAGYYRMVGYLANGLRLPLETRCQAGRFRRLMSVTSRRTRSLSQQRRQSMSCSRQQETGAADLRGF